jgi:hypothetical protein
MEPVQLEIPRDRALRGGDAFEVFSDHGTGQMDTAIPITDRPRPFWEGAAPKRGHFRDGHLSGRHLDQVAPDGHLEGRHLLDPHGWPAALLRFTTTPHYFGEVGFAVGTIDGRGNRSAELSPVVTRVINSFPRAADGLSIAGFDATARRLSVSFTASVDL